MPGPKHTIGGTAGTGMNGYHLLHFRTGTGKPKKVSQWSEREREVQGADPVVLDGNGKYKKKFLYFGTGTGKTKCQYH